MSRVCVKCLPKSINEEKLREHFASKGEVTDVRIVKTQSGKSRLFGFIGFRTDDQAVEAVKYFNNSFLGTSKIAVEFAKKFGDSSLSSSSYSKHTKKKAEKDEKKKILEESRKLGQKPKKAKSDISTHNEISKDKLDFLEAMKPRRQTKTWGNDEDGNYHNVPNDMTKSQPDTSDKDVGDSESDSDDSAIEVAAPTKDAVPTVLKPSLVSDMDFLKSKVSHRNDTLDSSDESSVAQDDDEFDDENDDDEKLNSNSESQRNRHSSSVQTVKTTVYVEEPTITTTGDSEEREQGDKVVASINPDEGNDNSDTGRLFVRNLPFSCTEEELSAVMTPFGPVTEIHLPLDAEKKGKGFGFVQFMIPEHANKAMDELDGSPFQGRLLHIIKAKEKKQDENSAENEGPRTYKQQKEDERKKLAGKRESWNAAYLHSDTVVTALAEKYGLQKGQVLDPTESGGEMAVRMAIGESHVQQDNREYFSSRGVDLTALESHLSSRRASQRSSTTLLVKNLPQDAHAEELETMFARFGSIASFLLPPSRTVALVDFVEPSEARLAFKGLAYRKYKHLPLYLEWAPTGVIDQQAAARAKEAQQVKTVEGSSGGSGSGSGSSGAGRGSDSSAGAAQTGKRGGAGEDEHSDDYSTLFVKNLSFDTTEAGLKTHISSILGQAAGGGLRAVSIPTKVQGLKNRVLSMGFGFAEFRTAQAAAEALTRLQGSLLDGHALQFKPSDKRLSTASSSAKRPRLDSEGRLPGTKIAVRNVAFQTTAAELKALFSSFGSVKRVRLPKKMGGEHRGFAFIDFASRQEAANAMSSLTNAHLYGRHLVLEWAKEEEQALSMSSLRHKAKQDEGAVAAQKRRRAASTGLSGGGDGMSAGDFVPDMSDSI